MRNYRREVVVALPISYVLFLKNAVIVSRRADPLRPLGGLAGLQQGQGDRFRLLRSWAVQRAGESGFARLPLAADKSHEVVRRF